MSRKSFISFKTEDISYKQAIQEHQNVDIIDKSLNEPINSDNEDYIMRKIREEYLADSTVTIHLIGQKSAEAFGYSEQRFIKRELQASLYHAESNSRNGILGVVLPSMYDSVYKGLVTCSTCSGIHEQVNINSQTTISEFHFNYYIPNNKCHHGDHERYCILAKWDDFIDTPALYIEEAYSKREHPIAAKIKVHP